MTKRIPARAGLAAAGVISLFAVGPRPCVAHSPAQERIATLNERMKVEPASAELYLARGEMHRNAAEWDAALSDYAAARRLAPGLDVLDLAEGRLHLDAGRPEVAEAAFDRFLAREPRHAPAYALRARARAARGNHLGAADDLSRAIATATEDSLNYEWYLERADALVKAGPEHRPEAILSLDQWRAAVGSIVVLDLAALDLELASGELAAALARVDRVLQTAPRNGQWAARRGEILERMGRQQEAQAAYAAALEQILALPAGRRASASLHALEASTRAALARVEHGGVIS